MSIKEDNILTKAINKKISRRSFIKWSSALGATASMSGLVMQAGAKVAGASHTNIPATGAGGSIVDWRPTCCLVCHSWCHIAAGVDANGHIRKIEGCGGQPKKYSNGNPVGIRVNTGAAADSLQSKSDDANHIPTGNGFLAYAPHNKGRICAKGNDGVEHLYDPDRIKYPLQRVGERGQGMWRRISWATALGTIAGTLRTMALAGHTHRLVVWVGRDENGSPKNFSKSYGTPNHIEHTSLCELSRHVAHRTLWGHHWSSVDMQEHTDRTQMGPNYGADTFAITRNLNDIDYYIEWGGNPAEAKIPHASCANHLGDRRRSNLVGYTDAAARGGATVYGRIVTIDVRQSNTAAFSDEYFQVRPGSDGALALYIMYGVLDGNSTTVRKELDVGHNGSLGRGASNSGKTDGDSGYDATKRLYFGLFKAEEGGAASGSAAWSVPTGKSLESYLFKLGTAAGESFSEHLGAASNSAADIKTKVKAVTGLDDSALDHLVDVFRTGVGGKFINVVVDGYRGPCKHTNGVYNYRAIRALNLIAPNFSAKQYNQATRVYAAATFRGGYNAPGAFQSDKNWDPYGGKNGNGGGTGGNLKKGGGWASPGVTNKINAFHVGMPADQAVGPAGGEAAPSGKQRLDNWDYELDLTRWRGSYKWVDQNLQCGIRHSIGLHAFTQGGLADASVGGPYATYDPTYTVEAVLWHKNAPTYGRPGQAKEIEMFIAKDGSGNYLIPNLWAIDIAMGDGTRFADIILPEVSYLERYSGRSGEGQEFNYRDNTFYRLPVYEVNGPTVHGQVLPRHLYDTRQVTAIFYELARTIEPGGAGNPDRIAAVWNGSLYDSWNFDSATDLGSVALNAATRAYVNDGEWAARHKFRGEVAAGTNINTQGILAGAASGEDFMRSHGMHWSTDDDPAYWRPSGFRGDDDEAATLSDSYQTDNGFKAKTQKQALQIYNSVLDTMPDVNVGVPTSATKSNGTFYGMPVYRPTTLQTSVTYPRHLTTYKVNVHVQSRTANLPRLQEIIGNSWAVLPVTGSDGSGNYCTSDDGSGRKIRNGEVVTVASPAGSLTCVAKVTEKAQGNCVHISHSQGHQRGIYTIDADAAYLNPHREAFGTYLVDGKVGRTIDRTINNPAGSPADDYAVDSVPPSAPGKGTHANNITVHHIAGAATGDNYNTCNIGGSQSWFGTKVRVY